MAYTVLARKYRPLRFSDVVGQDHVTRTLLNALAQNRIAHGYIFSGHRGIGKTTIARILASALNCRNAIGSELRPTPEPCNVCESCLEIRQGNAVDVIEIDAATNRGIDEIRELRDAARYRPSRDKYKIYILDEAHQITDAAFNALLKTLEEPPDHIVFMMATTQPEDIPQTIRSRCQHFSFHAVKLDDIVGQLRRIATDEHITADDATLSLLAEAGDGSMRDALSIMDQAIASAPLAAAVAGEAPGQPMLEAEGVRELMGTVSNVVYEQILDAVHRNNSADVLGVLNRLLDAGNGAPQLARQFVRYLRNCLVAKITGLSPETPATGIAADLLQISPEERARAARSAALFTEEDLTRFLSIVLRTFDELGYRQEQRFHLELGLLKLVHVQRLVPIEELLSQLGAPASPAIATDPTAISMASHSTPAISNLPTKQPTVPSPTIQAPPSPFEQDRTRRSPVMATAQSAGATPSTDGALALAPQTQVRVQTQAQAQPHISATATPVPSQPDAAPERPHLMPSAGVLTEPAAAAAPAPAAAEDLSLAALQAACVQALAAIKGQQSASDLIEDATFRRDGDTLQIQLTVSKAMLPSVVNAEAERILTATLREGIPGGRLKLLPGSSAGGTGAKAAPRKPRSAAAGSAADLAARHPIVQEAQRLFSADISNVIDLRDRD